MTTSAIGTAAGAPSTTDGPATIQLSRATDAELAQLPAFFHAHALTGFEPVERVVVAVAARAAGRIVAAGALTVTTSDQVRAHFAALPGWRGRGIADPVGRALGAEIGPMCGDEAPPADAHLVRRRPTHDTASSRSPGSSRFRATRADVAVLTLALAALVVSILR